MELMIDQFAITSIFGKANLQYFADVTCSGIVVTERFTYKYEYPVSQHSSVERESVPPYYMLLSETWLIV